MKSLKSLLLAAICMVFVISCEKEYSFEDGSGSTGIGTLKSDALGDCLPSSVSGIYKADSTLGSGNFIEVTVEATTPGSYVITSDTLNGYSFKGTGAFITVGLNTIRLQGAGKPLNAGTNDFVIRLNGSECFISVTVVAPSASVGSFTLGGAPGTCTGASASGTYTQGVPLTSSNTLTVSVNATTLGAYSITATSTNGMTFTKAGTFTTLGAQSVVLVGSGTPATSGAATITVANTAGNCTFSIPVVAGTGTTAVYTLGGAGATCTGAVVNGTYQAGVVTTATNTATINVNVTTIGTYTITSTAVNGVTFAKTGTFAATGAQTVVLTATGTPTAAGTFNYPTTGNASTCTFPVVVAPAGTGAAAFTLQGAPGVCSAAVIAGTYTAGTALTSSNAVTIQANVTTAGTYTITTAAVNGMTFSATGTFAGTGSQAIVLTGTGTPAAAGTNVFTSGTGSTCTFSITVGAGGPVNFINATINGVATTFNANLFGEIESATLGFPLFTFGGETTAGVDPYIEIGLAKQTGGIVPGTYTVNEAAGGILVGAFYFDAASVEYSILTDATPQTPGFTLIISTVTATRVTGTFFGTVKSAAGVTRTITSGSFSVPL